MNELLRDFLVIFAAFIAGDLTLILIKNWLKKDE